MLLLELSVTFVKSDSLIRFDLQHSDMSSEHSLSTVAEAILTVNYGSVFVTAFVLSLCNGAFNTLLMWHLHSMGKNDFISDIKMMSLPPSCGERVISALIRFCMD